MIRPEESRAPSCDTAPGHRASLRILATGDLHMSLMDYDYHTDAPARPGGAPGVDGIAAALSGLRGQAGASLLVDSGDFLQGGPMADFLGLERGLAPGAVHPMIAAMNHLGYDAVTLGNHDFSYGLEFLERALAPARFAVVSANVLRRDGGGPLVAPSAVLPVAVAAGLPPLRVGVIGLAPPQLVHWEEAQLRGRLTCLGMVAAARAQVPALRAAGADLVVALVHGGVGLPEGGDSAEHTARPLARLPGLDVLVLGHAHGVFPGPQFEGWADVDATAGRIAGRPAVMPGMHGSHIGVIDIALAHGADGWRHAVQGVRAVPVPPPAERGPGAPPVHAPHLRRIIAPVHAATRAHVDRPVGRAAVRLNTWFAQITDTPALRLIGAAKRAWARAALSGTSDAGLPILAAVAPFRAGGRGGPREYTDIPPGVVRLRHVLDLYPFPNGLRVLRMTGAGIAEWLERTAALYARLGPETGLQAGPARGAQPRLLSGAAPAYAFDVVDGAEYVLDLGAPAAFTPDGRRRAGAVGRVRDLRVGGQPLAPDAPCLLVTSSFRAAGGGGFPGTGPRAAPLPVDGDARTALIAHLRDAAAPPDGIAHATDPPRWRLAAPPGASALFHTAPEAAAHLAAIAALRPRVLGHTPEGFLRLKLHF